MPSLDMTRDDLIFMAIVLVLVVAPSQLAWLGNRIGRLIKGPARRD